MELFETKTCVRCGGFGIHFDGSVCSKCNGTGKQLTKRGHLTNQYYKELLSTPAERIKVGDLIKPWSMDTFFSKVTAVIVKTHNEKLIVEIHMGSVVWRGPLGARILTMPSADVREEKITAALEFQASLAKKGKPAKKS